MLKNVLVWGKGPEIEVQVAKEGRSEERIVQHEDVSGCGLRRSLSLRRLHRLSCGPLHQESIIGSDLFYNGLVSLRINDDSSASNSILLRRLLLLSLTLATSLTEKSSEAQNLAQ